MVRTRGIQSCRPVVIVNVNNSDISHETILGSDGQNPNLKSPFALYVPQRTFMCISRGLSAHSRREIDLDTQLDIAVHRGLPNNKRKRGPLVGSSQISVSELLKRQPRTGAGTFLAFLFVERSNFDHTHLHI